MNTAPYPHAARMSLQDVTVEFDGQMALSNVSFDVDAGTLMGVVGPNGMKGALSCWRPTT